MEQKLRKILAYLSDEMSKEDKGKFEVELNKDGSLKGIFQTINEVDSTLADENLLKFFDKLKKTQRRYKLLTQVDLDNNEITQREINTLVKEVDKYAGEEASENEMILAEHDNYVHQIETVNSLKEKDKKTRTLFTVNKFLAVASFVLFVALTSVLYRSILPTSDRLFYKYYNKYNAKISDRSSLTNNSLNTAIGKYKEGDYRSSVYRLGEIIRKDSLNKVARLYLGLSCLETKDYEKAIENLSLIVTQNDISYREEAEWYLSLCYVKTYQKNKAITLLRKISHSNSFHKSKAAILLGKLEN